MKKNIFLNDSFIFPVILTNAVIIFMQESHMENEMIVRFLNLGDLICTFIFIVEMISKHVDVGLRNYWENGWNRLDGGLVIISLPSVLMYFVPIDMIDVSAVLTLRLLRCLRVFRMMRMFPGFSKIINGFRLAMSKSYAVLLSFMVIIVVFGLINCSLFSEYAPQYFGTPMTSIFSVFQMCTIEGWYDIPNAVASGSGSAFMGHVISVYFCLLLIMGGIIGMSFINSVFVDAMIDDNNDELEKKLDEISSELQELKKIIAEMNDKKQ